MFKSNVGGLDRVVRILGGLALLSAILWYPGEERWFGLIGFVPLLTGLVRFCPIYPILGVSTRGDAGVSPDDGSAPPSRLT